MAQFSQILCSFGARLLLSINALVILIIYPSLALGQEHVHLGIRIQLSISPTNTPSSNSGQKKAVLASRYSLTAALPKLTTSGDALVV